MGSYQRISTVLSPAHIIVPAMDIQPVEVIEQQTSLLGVDQISTILSNGEQDALLHQTTGDMILDDSHKLAQTPINNDIHKSGLLKAGE